MPARRDGISLRSQPEVGYVALGLGRARSAEVEIRRPGGIRDCVTVTADEILPIAPGDAVCQR